MVVTVVIGTVDVVRREIRGLTRRRGNTNALGRMGTVSCKEREREREKERERGKRNFRVDATFVGCSGVGGVKIRVGGNETIDGFWHSCEQDNIRLRYAHGEK